MPSGSYSQTYPPFAHGTKYKMSEPPNPSWKLGQKVEATPQGREWLKGLDSGWQTIDVSNANLTKVYHIMTSGIIPRPIAFVSSVSQDGVGNLGCFSWFNQVATDPPVISISCSHRETRLSDTARNIRATKGFTVNIISEPWVQNANVCSVDAPPEVDEWPLSGLTKEPSTFVKAPRVKESAFSMECELLNYVDIIQPDTIKATNTLILGVVRYIHLRKDVINERGVVDIAKLMPVSRLGDVSFGRLVEGFRIPVPSWSNLADEVRQTLGEDVASGRKKLNKNEENVVGEDKGASASA